MALRIRSKSESDAMYKIIGADGKEYGPITAEQLRQWIAEGRANGQTKVLSEGATDWKPVTEFPEFAGSLGSMPAASLIPGPLPMMQAPRTNPMAITGMILGILALPFLCCCHGLPFNVLGIIFSAIALSQIKKDPQNEQGKAMAIAGLVLSILSLVLGVLIFAFGLAINSSDILRKIQNNM